MKILIATDAWEPQTNGIVTTLRNVERVAKDHFDTQIVLLTPQYFKTFNYAGIDFAWPNRDLVELFIATTNPDHIHIATEGPIGWMVRHYCLKSSTKFTTSYHTKFPEYLQKWFGIPSGLTYSVLRHFHNKSSSVMVATPTMFNELSRKGFNNLDIWHRGVDTSLFKPQLETCASYPIWLYVGRVSKEKNLPAFFELELPGQKIVVGDGPMLKSYKKKYPDINFVGTKHGEQLAAYYAMADVFVFPSKTDTFGHVMIEAMASGLPTAAYPVTGPLDIIQWGQTGWMDDNLSVACMEALRIAEMPGSKETIRLASFKYDWVESVREFLTLVKKVH